MVDSEANPSRLFGTTQFLGVGTIYSDPTTTFDDDDDDDDDDCGGLCFAQGDAFVEIEVDKYFPEPSSFPFFVHPYTLNVQDPTLLHFWTNGTRLDRPSAFYQFSIPYSVRHSDDIGAPTKLLETPEGVMIMDFVSGGYTAGVSDPNLILAISNTHLYIRSDVDSDVDGASAIEERPLPVTYAIPVTLEYDITNNGARILGPLTHARTVFMAVSSSDSRVLAITGWTSISSNDGDEAIFLTTDAGVTWQNITGNLRSASGVSGKVRPGGLEIVDLAEDGVTRALLVGTTSGISATIVAQDTSTQPLWVRLGACDEFPIVLTADVAYEPKSDKLIAATFGRGIYVLNNAKEKLQGIQDCVVKEERTEVARKG